MTCGSRDLRRLSERKGSALQTRGFLEEHLFPLKSKYEGRQDIGICHEGPHEDPPFSKRIRGVVLTSYICRKSDRYTRTNGTYSVARRAAGGKDISAGAGSVVDDYFFQAFGLGECPAQSWPRSGSGFSAKTLQHT